MNDSNRNKSTIAHSDAQGARPAFTLAGPGRRNPPGSGDNSLRRAVQPRGPGIGRGLVVGHIHGVDSEVGRLRTVLAHRPAAELLRLTPRTKDRLLFPAGLPWVAR